MNLFIDLLSDYLKSQCKQVLGPGGNSDGKITLVVQSFPSLETATTVRILDDYFVTALPGTSRAIKIAQRLWNEWPDEEKEGLQLGDAFKTEFIDQADQFTLYRNQGHCLLFGLDHASDRGGLESFHCVSEDLLWTNVLKGSFRAWVDRIEAHLNDDDPTAKDCLHDFFISVHKFNARSLVRVSRFIESICAQNPESLRDFVRICYARLPEWGGLPLASLPIGRNPARVNKLIDLSYRFSTHAIFSTRAERTKALEKIDKEEVGDSPFGLPELVSGSQSPYSTAAEYLEDVREYILKNSSANLAKLRRFDSVPILTLLLTRGPSKIAPSKATILKGYSDVVFLQAIFKTTEQFIDETRKDSIGQQIHRIDIELTKLLSDHDDLSSDLKSLLGGISGHVIPEEITIRSADSEMRFPINFVFSDDIPTPATSSTARLLFEVQIFSLSDDTPFTREFAWLLPSTHPERLRLALAKFTVQSLSHLAPPRLPSFQIGGFDELFFAADEEDLNRLIVLGMGQFKVVNSLDGLQQVGQSLITNCSDLTTLYRALLEEIISEGFYAGNAKTHRIVAKYGDIVDAAIEYREVGAEQVLPRLYRAFLTVRSSDVNANEYLDAAILLPISPFVLEQALARTVFIHDGFSEVLLELFSGSGDVARLRWEHLVGMAEMRRPIVALVCDQNRSLTTRARGFGITHLIGNPDTDRLSVVSQSLMREDGFEDDELSERLRPTAASRIYERLIEDYRRLHHHADDQLNLLFANVSEIEIPLAGVDKWLRSYLKGCEQKTTPFVLNVKVITTGVAATTALKILVAWRDHWTESEFVDQRSCSIRIGHRHAQTEGDLNRMLRDEAPLRFDIAVISHFLEGQHAGDKIERTGQFDHVEGLKVRQFPIAEYPRPAMAANASTQRKTLISNRRFRMASKHTELAARLKDSQADHGQEHVVLAHVDCVPWLDTIALLHEKALWVSCIDRYVDRNLVAGSANGAEATARRVVGFSCGLGGYGELNQTVSTEANTLARLSGAIAIRLRTYLSNLAKEEAEIAARNVITKAAEIPGLSLVRAAGHDEYIRDVVGYSLVSSVLGRNTSSAIEVLIPLDSFRHWFWDSSEADIPDLLFLAATVVNDRLDITAVVAECKFGLENSQLEDKAFAQAASGLRQLARVFAPYNAPIKTTAFERKYWWAQLHRALSSRAIVTLPMIEYNKLCWALERLSEGDFSISWQALAFTFWVDRENIDSAPSFMGSVDVGTTTALPDQFGVHQVQFGANDIKKILIGPPGAPFALPGTPLTLSDEVVLKPSGEILPSAPDSPAPPPEDGETKKDGKALPTSSGSVGITSAVEQQESPPSEVAAVDAQSVVTKSAPIARVLLGVDGRGTEIFWEFGDSELENRHLLIFGGSGSGKTYAIQGILIEMAKAGQHTAIIDYTDGFLPSHLDPVFAESTKAKTHVLAHEPFPINPFQRLAKDEPGIGLIEEKAHNVASRVADVFCSVYTVGDVQRAALTHSIEKGLKQSQDFSLDDLLVLLETTSETSGNLALKISEFVKQDPFSPGIGSGWENIYSGNQLVHILQLTSLSSEIQKLITEFALWDLFAYATRHGNKNKPLPVVLDEMQNLDHRNNQALDKLLREGRKFGVGLILATQTISNFDKEQKGRLFQAGHKLFFKPAETERQAFAQILADTSQSRTKTEWIAELSKLNKGECWSIGPRRVIETGVIRREPVKLKVLENGQRVLS